MCLDPTNSDVQAVTRALAAEMLTTEFKLPNCSRNTLESAHAMFGQHLNHCGPDSAFINEPVIREVASSISSALEAMEHKTMRKLQKQKPTVHAMPKPAELHALH